MTVAKKRRKKPWGPFDRLKKVLSKIVAVPKDLIRKSKARHVALDDADTKRVTKRKKRKEKPTAPRRAS
jgi:hypothetical protein